VSFERTGEAAYESDRHDDHVLSVRSTTAVENNMPLCECLKAQRQWKTLSMDKIGHVNNVVDEGTFLE
jgi:hypothetical protein